MQKVPIIILSVLLAISVLFNISLAVRIMLLEERLATKSEKNSAAQQKATSKPPTEARSGRSAQPSSPADAGLVKGLGRSVLESELSRWQTIGLVTNFEFSGDDAVVYLNHSDWISLPSKSKADFKAGIRSKWPDGSVIFRDSQTGERL
jgi:hypothetical protein